MKVRIGKRLVGEGEPCFIVAEAGVNHNGNIGLAKKLVDVAKDVKADAVKFQVFKAKSLITRTTTKAEYQNKATGWRKSRYEMLKKLELTQEEFEELARYAQKKGITFFSSPFDFKSVDILDHIDVPAFKIASGEITNFPLLTYVAKKGRPVILSTGMATLKEIREAVNVIKRETEDIIILHCVTSYPAKVEEMNLRFMETLRSSFGFPVGLSDHTVGITIPIAATALGAVMIEKHFTLNKNLPGPDHKASIEPNELKEMVRAIRDVEKAMGSRIKRITEREKEIKKIARKSIVAKVDISKGVIITNNMLEIKRPGTGIEPKYMEMIVGRKAKANIKKGDLITMEMLR